MRLIAILIALFGSYIIWYGLFTPLTHSGFLQYMMLGGGFMFGGLFLYVYIGKRERKNYS